MEENEKNGVASLFAEWTRSFADLWGEMIRHQAGGFGPAAGPWSAGLKGPSMKAHKNLEFGAKIAQTFMSMLNDPDNLNELLKGADAVPDVMMDMARHAWEGYFDIQKQYIERAAKLGQKTEAYKFEDIDHTFFETVKELYEEEIQKLFQIPQVGLTRFYQERVNRMLDRFNIFQAALNEFLYMFYVPIEKSSSVMQEKVEEMTEKGDISENFKDYYNMWIKILEGHYMKLLQSGEYTQVLDNTIRSLAEYRKAREEVMYDMLQNLPVPTNKEMDELYEEFYLLKKQVKQLAKKLENKKP